MKPLVLLLSLFAFVSSVRAQQVGLIRSRQMIDDPLGEYLDVLGCNEYVGWYPFLRGTTPRILMDFRSPRRPLPKFQDYWDRMGLISNKGEKKKAFYVMREWYEELEKSGSSKQ